MTFIPLSKEDFKKAQEAYLTGNRDETINQSKKSLMPDGSWRSGKNISEIVRDDDQFKLFYEFVRLYVNETRAKAMRTWKLWETYKALAEAQEVLDLTFAYTAMKEKIENDPIFYEFMRDRAKLLLSQAEVVFFWEKRKSIREAIELLTRYAERLADDNSTKSLMLIEISLLKASLSHTLDSEIKKEIDQLYEQLYETNPHRVITVLLWCVFCPYNAGISQYAQELLENMQADHHEMITIILNDQQQKNFYMRVRAGLLLSIQIVIPAGIILWIIRRWIRKNR